VTYGTAGYGSREEKKEVSCRPEDWHRQPGEPSRFTAKGPVGKLVAGELNRDWNWIRIHSGASNRELEEVIVSVSLS
jgi:hypothetical protein